ncbi:hypothetical protein BVRB_5g098050 isoform A [Beta vulgaris subsp. vulgaris]|nr:hypothetical protein BVRB_5g098050 isoform A [Beta vulgaris subsp. vulgaris]
MSPTPDNTGLSHQTNDLDSSPSSSRNLRIIVPAVVVAVVVLIVIVALVIGLCLCKKKRKAGKTHNNGDTDESTDEGSEQVVAPDPTPQVRTQGKDNEAPVSSPIVETSQRDVAVVDETADVESDHEETVVEESPIEECWERFKTCTAGLATAEELQEQCCPVLTQDIRNERECFCGIKPQLQNATNAEAFSQLLTLCSVTASFDSLCPDYPRSNPAPPPTSPAKLKLIIVVSVASAAVLLIVIIVGVVLCCRKPEKKQEEVVNSQNSGAVAGNVSPARADENMVTGWKCWRDGRSLEFMDPTLRDSYSNGEITRCIHLGLLCVQEEMRKRPSMSNIVLMLNSNFSVGAMSTPQPPAFMYSGNTDQSTTTNTTSMPWSSGTSTNDSNTML